MNRQPTLSRRKVLVASLDVVGFVVVLVLLTHPAPGQTRLPMSSPAPAALTSTPEPPGVRARYATLEARNIAIMPTSVTAMPPDVGSPVAIPRAAINIRAGPGTTYAIVGTADPTARLAIEARDPSGQWWQVQFERSELAHGWVRADVVLVEGDANRVPVMQ